ncbi:MAG: PD-(D/E)XK nuclease family protein [Ignavibacteriaceae bacterium]
MIGKIENINFKRIQRISPSQFYSMKNCAYKSLLSEAFENKPLLPVSPNAFLGTVTHKILELIIRREINNEMDFDLAFNSEISAMEASMLKQGLYFFVPLQKNVKDFGIKKVQLKKYLVSTSTKQFNYNVKKYIAEKWFESKDGTVAGKIDLIIEEDNKVEIVDFKTGSVTNTLLDDSGEAFTEIKTGYIEQLSLYAYLYYDATGKFPTHLTLVDLTKQKFNIDFSFDKCKAVYKEAKDLLNKVNDNIENAISIANPSIENCKYCLYRPACTKYLDLLKSNNAFNDASGFLQKVIQYKNGNITVLLNSSWGNISITGFSADNLKDIENYTGNELNFFNLKKETVKSFYSVTKTSKIYEQQKEY